MRAAYKLERAEERMAKNGEDGLLAGAGLSDCVQPAQKRGPLEEHRDGAALGGRSVSVDEANFREIMGCEDLWAPAAVLGCSSNPLR